MAGLSGIIAREGPKTRDEAESQDYGSKTVPDKVQQYRVALQSDGRLHWRLCAELVTDLEYLDLTVRRLFRGEGVSFFEKLRRRRKFDQKGTQLLLDTIEIARVAVAREVLKGKR